MKKLKDSIYNNQLNTFSTCFCMKARRKHTGDALNTLSFVHLFAFVGEISCCAFSIEIENKGFCRGIIRFWLKYTLSEVLHSVLVFFSQLFQGLNHVSMLCVLKGFHSFFIPTICCSLQFQKFLVSVSEAFTDNVAAGIMFGSRGEQAPI